MTDEQKRTLRKRAKTAVIVLILLLPWFAPGLTLKGVDGVLTVIDSHMERGPLPSDLSCGGPKFDAFDINTFFVRGLLKGDGLDNRYAQTLDWAKSYNSARCEAMERWLRNRGFPSLSEMEALQELRGPVLRVRELYSADQDIRNTYSVYSFVAVAPSGATMPFFDDPNLLTRTLVDRLTSVLPAFGDQQVQARIAWLVQQYPSACLDVPGGRGFTLALLVKPAEDDNWTIPLSKRRMVPAGASIYACLEKALPECSNHLLSDAMQEFTLQEIENLLTQCRIATEARIAEGMRYDQWVYDAHPELPAPAAIRDVD